MAKRELSPFGKMVKSKLKKLWKTAPWKKKIPSWALSSPFNYIAKKKKRKLIKKKKLA